MNKLEVSEENASRFVEWLKNRGGLAVWKSINFSNLGASWTTPAKTESGEPTGKPSWQSANTPDRIITNAAEVEVITRKEVKRFHVGIRRTSNGFGFKCTDGATRRIDRELNKAGEDASYYFDYEYQDAVITVPDGRIGLDEWIRNQENKQ